MVKSGFEKVQLGTIKKLEKLAKEGGYMEKRAVMNALQVLRQKIFDLSYDNVHKRAVALEKKLCLRLDSKWDDQELACESEVIASGERRKFRLWYTTPIGFERMVDVEAATETEAKEKGKAQVPEGSVLRSISSKR